MTYNVKEWVKGLFPGKSRKNPVPRGRREREGEIWAGDWDVIL